MIMILFVTGFAVGIVSSFFGIGGGTIMMPILYAEFPQIPANIAIANSLGVIAITSATNLFFLNKSGNKFDKKMALVTSIFMGLSTIIGSELSHGFEDQKLRLLLAWVLAFSALQTLIKKSNSYPTGEFRPAVSLKNLSLLALTSSLSGLLAGLTGLGGGIILIPFFISVLKMPLRQVPLYTNIGMLAGTLFTFTLNIFKKAPVALNFGEFNHYFQPLQFGLNNLAIIALLFTGSFIGSRTGVKGLKIVSNRQAKYLFFFLQAFFSLRLFIKNW
jgi:uncharacterized protein